MSSSSGAVPRFASEPRVRQPRGYQLLPLLNYTVIGGLLLAIFLKFSLHSVPEGHVGVYWRGGSLLSRVTEPGLRLKVPFLDVHSSIQVTLQTDKVSDIPCGTKGVMVTFDKVEVVNRLKKEHVLDTIKAYGEDYDNLWIFSKIHHEMNQLCSHSTLQDIYIDKFDQIDEILKDALQADCTKYAPGIEIFSVRVTKPRLPRAIEANYEAMEAERTRVGVARERALVVTQEAETEHRRAVMIAEKEAETSRIHMQQLLAERQAEQMREAIQNEMYLAKQRMLADSEFYRTTREAEANKAKLTPEYLQLAFMQAIANNTKLYFGEKLPNMLLDLHRILPAAQGRSPVAANSQPQQD
ncbi:g8129 [Coccomyxa elongata]